MLPFVEGGWPTEILSRFMAGFNFLSPMCLCPVFPGTTSTYLVVFKFDFAWLGTHCKPIASLALIEAGINACHAAR